MKSKLLMQCLFFLFTCSFCSAASAEFTLKQFRIGMIGENPGQILQDFDPFLEYLTKRLRSGSGIQEVTLFVAKDINQMRALLKDGKIDFILTTAFPIVELEREKLLPSVLAWQGGAREYPTVFFVRKDGRIRDIRDLKEKTIVFGTASSTYAYATAKAELKKNGLPVSASTEKKMPEGAVRYEFAGEAVNQAFWVIQGRADAGVFSSSDWEELSQKERSKLRIIWRTRPITHLLGSFHPSFPSGSRQAVENELIGMHESRKGQKALSSALNITKFERLTQEDRRSFRRLKKLLSAPD